MSALTMSRSLAGSRAFTVGRPTRAQQPSNGAKWFMKRRDNFIVEVQVPEEETEDRAVNNFMKQVVDSHVINDLRNRRYKESKIDTMKRKFQRRVERGKAMRDGIFEPTWEEVHGEDPEPKPFDEFFSKDESDDLDLLSDLSGEGGLGDEQGGEGLMADLRKFGGYSDGGRGGQRWGSYVDSGNAAGGYQGQYQSGGYMGGYAGGSSAAAGSSSSVGSYNS